MAKIKEKKPIEMTKVERDKKINMLKLELAMMDIRFYYPDDFRIGVQNYIDKGTEFHGEYELPQHDRFLVVELYNDKRKRSQFILRHASNMKEQNPKNDNNLVLTTNDLDEYPDEPILP
jgi:uncharacterized protein YjiK